MSLLRHIGAGLRRLTRSRAVLQELDDELRHWMELAVAERMRHGVTREQAEREIRLDVGSPSALKEHAESGGWEIHVEAVVRDVRYALRNLQASPAYAATAIAMLSVAIAVTTTLLTVSNTVLRQQWAVPEPSRIFTLVTARGAPRFSPAEARYLNQHATTFGGIIAVRCMSGARDDCELSVNDMPASVDFVSGNYFDVVGLPLRMGRGFAVGEDEIANPAGVAVISEALWRSRFGSDPKIVGATIRIDDVRFTVVGVAGAGFTGTRTERKDVWLPLSSMLLLHPGRADVKMQLTHPSSDVSEAAVAGRLATTATREQAVAELNVLDRQYRQDNNIESFGVRLIPTTYFPNPAKLGTAAATFTSMFVAVLLVLLLACANVGNLLLARATARGREIGVRLALGASRARVVRQLLTEGLLLSIVAGVLGISASLELPTLIMTRAFGSVSWHFAPDATVIAAATAVVLLTCLAFGLAPSLHATSNDVTSVIKAGDGGGQARSRRRLRGTLLALQVAVSLLLLVNAGLVANGIQRGEDSNPGFATHSVGVLTIELPGGVDSLRRAAFVNQFEHDSRVVPGIRVAFGSVEPLGAGRATSFRLPSDAATRVRMVGAFDVSPGFLDLIQLPIVAGRDLQPVDGDGAVLVNQTLAQALWPGENPLGQVIIDGVERRVVGVVKDARMYRIGAVDGALFRPIARGTLPKILTRPVSPAITEALSAIATRIEPRAIIHADSIAGNVDRQLGGLRVIALLAGALGFIALIMASVGVFGVFAYIVQQRTREIGIRTALGASWIDVSALVLRDSARSVMIGLGVGLVLSLGVARIISSELYGASPYDWRTLVALASLLASAGAAATFVPIRRATRVDPVVALRSD